MVPIISLESEINIFWLFISEGIFNLTLPFFVVTDMRGVNHGFRTACQHKTVQTEMYRLAYGVVKYRVKSVTCSLPLSTWAYPESLCPSLFFKWGLLLYTVITTTRFPLDFPKGEQLCEISMHALWDGFFNQLIFAFSGKKGEKMRACIKSCWAGFCAVAQMHKTFLSVFLHQQAFIFLKICFFF